jgi:hypothetical protein
MQAQDLARPLSEQETKDFLTTKALMLHIGTGDEKGHANIHPAWYHYDNPKEKIYIETRKHSKKWRIKRSDDLLLHSRSLNTIHTWVWKGSLKVHEHVTFNAPIVHRIHLRYLGTLEHLTTHGLIDAMKKSQSVVLEISPNYSTGDYSKNS